MMKKNEVQLTRIVFGAVMAALVFVVTLFRFPLLGSKVHFANAVCLLCGLLLRLRLRLLGAGGGAGDVFFHVSSPGAFCAHAVEKLI